MKIQVLKKKWKHLVALLLALLLALLSYGCTSRFVGILVGILDGEYFIPGRDTAHFWEDGMFVVSREAVLLYNPETIEEDFKEQRFTYGNQYHLHVRGGGMSTLERVESYLEIEKLIYVYSPNGYAILNREDGSYRIIENADGLTEEEKEVFANRDLFKTFGRR
ncbi:MAG: hypothetical protein FWD25_01785 [Clostridia bacterium]|nr:hypothetical protein [Clostridia bacterium]